MGCYVPAVGVAGSFRLQLIPTSFGAQSTRRVNPLYGLFLLTSGKSGSLPSSPSHFLRQVLIEKGPRS